MENDSGETAREELEQALRKELAKAEELYRSRHSPYFQALLDRERTFQMVVELKRKIRELKKKEKTNE